MEIKNTKKHIRIQPKEYATNTINSRTRKEMPISFVGFSMWTVHVALIATKIFEITTTILIVPRITITININKCR